MCSFFKRICHGQREVQEGCRKSSLVFRWCVCGIVSGSGRAVWRGCTGADEISGSHDDEQGADYRGISEKNRCVYVWYLVFYVVCTVKQHGFLQWKSRRKSDPGLWRLSGREKRMLPYVILLLLVYGVAVLFYRNQQILDSVTLLLWKIGTPFVAGVPVLLCLTGRKPDRGMEERRTKKGRMEERRIEECGSKEHKDERKNHNKKVRVVVLAGFLFGCLFLEGCNVAELEDKEFPVLLNIRDQDTFESVWLNHEYAGNKKVDYNHLKVVLIEQSFLEKEAAVDGMLSMLEQEKEIPWNAYVMTTDSYENLAQTEEELDTLIGKLSGRTSGKIHRESARRRIRHLECCMRSAPIIWKHFIFHLWM